MTNKLVCKNNIVAGLTLMTSLGLSQFIHAETRWYDPGDIEIGASLFKQNCASCHGQNAEGTSDWKTTDENGNFPPPPLNGTAHSWHHSKDLLKRTIRNGGAELGGVMPGFSEQLSDTEIDQVIAYFQSKWPDEIYQRWAGRNKASDIPSISEVVETSQKETAQEKMTRLLKLRLGSDEISEPVETPVDGIFETQFGKNFGYLTEDGRYLFMGNLIDLKQGQNLTDLRRRKITVAEISQIDLKDKIVFSAEGIEKGVLTIFTDTSCPYCQKLHGEISELQKAGISVHYLPYPRGGKQGPGYQTLKQVWCAEDRAKAMTIAKGHDVGDLPSSDCAGSSLVDKGYALGNRLGINGTPALYKTNGELIQGYVPFQQLIPRVLTN